MQFATALRPRQAFWAAHVLVVQGSVGGAGHSARALVQLVLAISDV